MRKTLTLLLLMLILSLVLSTVKIWFSWEGYDDFKAAVEKFARESGIKVEVTYVRKVEEKLYTTAKGGEKYLPDIILMKSDKVRLFSNIFEDLGNVVKGKPILMKALKAFEVDGKVLAMPFYFDVGGVIIYNADIVKDPGRVSFEKIVETSKALNTRYPFLIPIYGSYYFQIFQRTFGKKEIDLNFKDKATLDAFEFLIDVKKRLVEVPWDRRGLVAAFMRGESGYIMFGSFMIPKFLSKGMKIGIVYPPYIEKTGRVLSANLDFKGFAVVRGRLTDEVKKILEFVTSYDFQRSFCSKYYKFPVNGKAFDSLKNKNGIFERMYDYYIHGAPTPSFDEVNVYYEAVNTALKIIIKGETDPIKVAEAAEKVVEGWK